MESGLARQWLDLCVTLNHNLSVFSKLHLARFANTPPPPENILAVFTQPIFPYLT